MTKLTRKLMISVFTLAFALVTLGASTFAWFTLTSVSTIDNLEMEIIAGNYMEISVDGENFKNFITTTDILAAVREHMTLGENPLPKLDAVTTENGYEFTDVEGNDKDSYIQFKIWFKANEKDAKVFLGKATETSSLSKTWISDTNFTYRNGASVGKNTALEVFAADSLRFSIQEYNEGHTTGGAVKIFEIDSNHGESEVTNIKLGKPTGVESMTTNGLLSYWENKLGANKVPTLPEGFQFPEVVHDGGLGNPETATVALTRVQKTNNNVTNYYGYALVRIWIEGWDPDCFDSILNTKLYIKFSFELDKPDGEDD